MAARDWPSSLALGLVGILLTFWGQFSSGMDLFFGDRGDARLHVYLCEHWYQAFDGRASLLSPGMFYPLTNGLARSDLVLATALPYSALRLIGVEPFLAVQLVVIGSTVLAYLAALALMRWGLKCSVLSSSLGAAFFAFNAPKLFQMGHLQLQSIYLLPAAFLALALATGVTGRARATFLLSGAGLALVGQLATSFYLGWFCGVWLAFWLGGALLLEPSRRWLLALVRRLWLPLNLGGLITALGLVALAMVYMPMLHGQKPFDYGQDMIPHWWSPLAMGDGNYLWGRLMPGLIGEPRSPGWWEGVTGVGVVFSLAWLALSLWCLGPGRRVKSPGRCCLVALVMATNIFYFLDMVYFGHSPWWWVRQLIPGGAAIRAPGRAILFLTLPMAMGLSWMLDHLRLRPWLVGLAVLGLAEQVGVARSFSLAPERAYLQAMAVRVPADCTAFYVVVPPNDHFRGPDHQVDAILISQLCRRPTLNGFTGLTPDAWDLGDLNRPDLKIRVQSWVDRQGIKGPVYRLELWPPVESFGPP